MNREQRRKILQHPDRYDEGLLEQAKGEERDPNLRERKQTATRDDVGRMLAHYHGTRIVPVVKELDRRLAWFELPLWRRWQARLVGSWEWVQERWAEYVWPREVGETVGRPRDRRRRN